MPKVLNKRVDGVPSGAVYIGRSSICCNPFVIGKDGSRDEVIAKYEAWLLSQPDLLSQLAQLRGKDVVCWCAPCLCHGEVLVRLASKGRGRSLSIARKDRDFRPYFLPGGEAARGASSPVTAGA